MGSETPDTVLTNMSNTGVVASTPEASHNFGTNNGDHRWWRIADWDRSSNWHGSHTSGQHLQQSECRLCLRMWIGIPHNTEASPSAGHASLSVSDPLTTTIGIPSTCVSCKRREPVVCLHACIPFTVLDRLWSDNPLIVGPTPVCVTVVGATH